jgi:hypothetical protein
MQQRQQNGESRKKSFFEGEIGSGILQLTKTPQYV